MIAAGERVWVVPRGDLFPDGAPRGFVPRDDRTLRCIRERGHFAPRAEVEEDPSLKQIIPYALVARGGDVFLFRRTDRGGERRLFGLRSVGVGGHVNPVDAADPVGAALRRELAEELFLPAGWSARIAGFLNDDDTPVGSVHFGVVAVVAAPPGDVRVREADTMSGTFVPRGELLGLHARERASFEGWSALLLDRLDEVLAWAGPHGSSSTTRSATPTSTT